MKLYTHRSLIKIIFILEICQNLKFDYQKVNFKFIANFVFPLPNENHDKPYIEWVFVGY